MKKALYVIVIMFFVLTSCRTNQQQTSMDKIMFVRVNYSLPNEAGAPSIFIYENGIIRKIIQNGRNPSLFPDSKKIAYERPETNEDWQNSLDIGVANVDGSTQVNLTQTRMLREYSPRVSPDAKIIAFAMENDVCFMKVDGKDRWCTQQTNYRMTEDLWDPTKCGDGIPHYGVTIVNDKFGWEPQQDKGELNFIVGARDLCDNYNLYSIHLTNNGMLSGITLVTTDAADPSVGPNRKIAFWAPGTDVISVVKTDGTNRILIASNPGIPFVWSPNGDKIAYTQMAPDIAAFISNSDGSNQRRIASGSTEAWSPDGKMLVISRVVRNSNANNSDIICNLYSVDVETKIEEQITNNKAGFCDTQVSFVK